LAESTHETEVAVEVLRSGLSVARLYFSDVLREDSKTVVSSLKARGLKVFILSGDRQQRCQAVAEACGIPQAQTYGELFPEDKEDILKKHHESCMLGDGANDSLSIKSADVGIAVKGSVDLSLLHANVYFTRGGLQPFVELLAMAQKTRVVLLRNLTISLVYNLIGGTLALLGWIDPMLAAILMPLSSSAIIFSSLWGFR
jgi:Cu2+-exporting ATPase/Cu+-exporting ATPase